MIAEIESLKQEIDSCNEQLRKINSLKEKISYIKMVQSLEKSPTYKRKELATLEFQCKKATDAITRKLPMITDRFIRMRREINQFLDMKKQTNFSNSKEKIGIQQRINVCDS